MKSYSKRHSFFYVSVLCVCLFLLTGCGNTRQIRSTDNTSSTINETIDNAFDISNIPDYSGIPYVEINKNQPYFSAKDKKRTDTFEEYSELDALGRCGIAYANICKEIQPTEERGQIGSVKPSGWHTVKYNGYIEGNYLYNRCHLIGYQLAGENANERNLITGTRYMNCDGQLPYENQIDDYVDTTGNHVLYRVTPIFEDENLIASGVLTEAYSVEDDGKGIQFCLYFYNVQPGIRIDYMTGESEMISNYKGEYARSSYFSTGNQIKNKDEQEDTSNVKKDESKTEYYILNTNSKKIHTPNCQHAATISATNKKETNQTVKELEKDGYSSCKVCRPK